MLLQCPSCSARFIVADALIPPEGRTVKCGKCANLWHVDAPPPSPTDALIPAESSAEQQFAAMLDSEPANEEPIPPRQALAPAPWAISKIPFMVAAPLLAACWAFLAFVAYYPTWMPAPFIGILYEKANILPTDGLAFNELALARTTKDGQTQFVLSGSIANQSAYVRMLPKVRVQLHDKDGDVMLEREYPVNEKLSGGDIYPFRITNIQTSLADKVTNIVVDLGNPLQLAVR